MSNVYQIVDVDNIKGIIPQIENDSKAFADPDDPTQQVYLRLACLCSETAALAEQANKIAREAAAVFELYVSEAVAREAEQ